MTGVLAAALGLAAAGCETGGGDEEHAKAGPVVPYVVGLSLDRAKRQVVAAGWVTRVSRQASPKPDGEVVSQQPAAGTALEPDGTVVLVVSRHAGRAARGPGLVPVPSLVGKQYVPAGDLAEKRGLVVESAPVRSRKARGEIVLQQPARGKRRRGSLVRVEVSVGPGARLRAPVPDFTGFGARTARADARALGFSVRQVLLSSASLERGQVVRQRPAYPATAPEGSVVTLFVGPT